MSDTCNNDCSSCGESCTDRKEQQNDFSAKLNESSKVKKVYGIISGKGGVGKSLVTAMLAAGINKKGFSTAVLDADITGPSIPKLFGITEPAMQNDKGLLPAISEDGVKLMSVNLLLPNNTDPVVWRGPIIANVVKQFWTDVVWGDIDYMFIDMPPGTGDVPLTIFQSLPVDGLIVVTSPQDLVSMIARKAVRMAEMMNVPIVAMVENMSYFKCPDCGSNHNIFGESKVDAVAKEHSIELIAKLPIDPEFAKLSDEGKIENYNSDELNKIIDFLGK
ncbi:MAG: Mrp/NBP35 family ATP-binding protein [Clostridia bacterium]|nr:Mrp/NBP35 family ATP-binding protein [Clostridia bacterium]